MGAIDSLAMNGSRMTITGDQIGIRRNAFIGSCKHRIWEAIRASSAAPYYLDDFSLGIFLFLGSDDFLSNESFLKPG